MNQLEIIIQLFHFHNRAQINVQILNFMIYCLIHDLKEEAQNNSMPKRVESINYKHTFTKIVTIK